MKKLISILLISVLAFTVCTFAVSFGKAEGKTSTDLPDSVGIPVTLNAEVNNYRGEVEEGGKANIFGQGFEAESDSAPEGARWLVVNPIDYPEALEWFCECIGNWHDTGIIYAVYYEDSDGNHMDAPGVHMKVKTSEQYDDLNVFSVHPDNSSAVLDYMYKDLTVEFTTNGKLYYGVVYRQGNVPDNTNTAVPSTTVPSTEVPGTSVPPTDVPGTDVPGTDVPNTDVPGTDVPSSEVPGTDVPNTNVPPTDNSDTNVPPTGGNANITLCIVLMAVSVIVIAAGVIRMEVISRP